MKKAMFFAPLAALSLAATPARAAVFDDATVWWKFDHGRTNGTIAVQADIHDVRDTSKAVPKVVGGADGGPAWTNLSVRLCNARASVQSSALDFDSMGTEADGGIWADALSFGDVAITNNGDISFFARIRPAERYVETLGGSSLKAFTIYNNIFKYNSTAASAYGQLFMLVWNETENVYEPLVQCGQYTTGNAEKVAKFEALDLEPGKWYELGFSLHRDGDQYQALCMLCGEDGIAYQTKWFACTSTAKPTATATAIASYSAGYVLATDGYKTDNIRLRNMSYRGLLHEMAVWDRAVSMDEMLDAFGRPARSGVGVYSDAVHWWKFNTDADGDGALGDGEVRDVRYWGTAAAAAEGNLAAAAASGAHFPAFASGAVDMPSRGETVETKYLHFAVETPEGGSTALPAKVEVPGGAVAGSVTVVARLRHTKAFNSGEGRYVLNNQHDYSASGGQNFGFLRASNQSDESKCYPYFFVGGKAVSAVTIPLTTNVWYDVAYTYDLETGTASVKVGDPDRYLRSWSGSSPTNFFKAASTSLVFGSNTFDADVQQLAIWDRVLSDAEIMEAFGAPHALFAVGLADGSAGEFGVAGEGASSFDTSDPAWHGMAGTLDQSARTLTLFFTPPAGWQRMAQGFRLSAAQVGDGTGEATVSLSVNGESVGTQTVTSGADAWWYVPRHLVRAGANTATLTLASGSPAVEIDRIDMAGSWAVVSGSNGDFAQQGASTSNISPDFWVGDRNMAHVVGAVSASTPTNRLHFYVPGALSEKYRFDFSATPNAIADSGTPAVKLHLNGTELGSWNSAPDEPMTVSINPGTLLDGWNEIAVERTAEWTQFGSYELRMEDLPVATVIVIR